MTQIDHIQRVNFVVGQAGYVQQGLTTGTVRQTRPRLRATTGAGIDQGSSNNSRPLSRKLRILFIGIPRLRRSCCQSKNLGLLGLQPS